MTEVSAQLHQVFKIKLDGYGTTGHIWKPVFDGEVFESLGNETVIPDADSIGGSGQKVFTFRPLTPGEFTIVFELIRPWKPSDVAERREFCVRVAA